MRFRGAYRLAPAAIGICALLRSAGAPAQQASGDPAETVNRAILNADMTVDRAVLRPVAEAYRKHLPAGIRQGVHNLVRNLASPAVAINQLLQGNSAHAWQTVQRLAINSALGGGGVVDVAAGWGMPAHDADFGETLAVWGVGAGPYLVLPLLGPSDARDAVGTAVDAALNPLSYAGVPAATYAQIAASGAHIVDTRARHLKDLDALQRTSVDFYATLRSVYRQRRDAEIEAARSSSPIKIGRAAAGPEDTP